MKYNNILHIDDDPEDCELFLEALKTLGEPKYTAIHNSIEAVRKLLSGIVQPDVIILDLNMPIFNGYEILAILKKEKDLCDIPVIVFSTSVEKTTRIRAMNAGASNYIPKPDNFQSLRQNLKNFLA